MIIGRSAIGESPGIGESYDITDKTYSLDILIKNAAGATTYGGTLYVKKTQTKTVGIDLAAMKRVIASYTMTAYLKHTITRYQMGIRMVLAPEARGPTDTVINTLLWSYGETIDAAWRTIDTIGNGMTLGYATNQDLDSNWGEAYRLKRRTGQSDDSYRSTLQNYVEVLTGCGTKPICERVIKRIIGNDDVSLTPVWPSTVIITFDTETGMRAARQNQDLLEDMIPRMLAAGVQWNLLIPLLDYEMDIRLLGAVENRYQLKIALGQKDVTASYPCRMLIVRLRHKTVRLDMEVQKTHEANNSLDIVTKKQLERSVTNRLALKRAINAMYELDATIRKTVQAQVNLGIGILRYDVEAIIGFQLALLKDMERVLSMGIRTILAQSRPLAMDMLLRFYGKTYEMDVLCKKPRTSAYGMIISLV